MVSLHRYREPISGGIEMLYTLDYTLDQDYRRGNCETLAPTLDQADQRREVEVPDVRIMNNNRGMSAQPGVSEDDFIVFFCTDIPRYY